MDEKLLHEEERNLESEITIEKPSKKHLFTKKKLLVLGVILAVVAILAVILLIPSHFERVKDNAAEIAGQISSRSKNEFTIDTYPYEDTTMKPSLIAMLAPRSQENALKAIKYVNEEFGFGSYLYDQMMETTALMGLQSEENDNYKVTWKYHPDEGLEVTYLKK